MKEKPNYFTWSEMLVLGKTCTPNLYHHLSLMPHPAFKIRFHALLRYLGIIYCSHTKVRSKSFWTMVPQTSSSEFKGGGRQMLLSYHCWDNCNPCCAFSASGILKIVKCLKIKKKKKRTSIFLNTTSVFIA